MKVEYDRIDVELGQSGQTAIVRLFKDGKPVAETLTRPVAPGDTLTIADVLGTFDIQLAPTDPLPEV